jgi:DNA-binding transcriptional LysR family regulator
MRNRTRGVDWDDLRFFLAVVRTGTLSAAAQQLAVDDTTVGRRVEGLERSLNTKLFERHKVGYHPTLAGERLLQTAESVESAILASEAELADRNLSLTGVVRVGAPDGFGTYFLAPRLAEFCSIHPRIEVHLIATARLFSLSKREADIAIALAIPTQGRVVARKLVDYRLGLYASRQYLDGHSPIHSVADLREHLIVGYIDELLFTPLLDYLRVISSDISPRFRSGNLVAQLHASREGGGIAVLPAFMADRTEGLVPVLASEVRIRRTFYLLVHEDNRSLARIRVTADYIQAQVEKHRRLFDPPG